MIPEFLFRSLKRAYNKAELKINYRNDMKRYTKYSFELSRNRSKRHMETNLIFFYHKIEKGLSLPHPRVGFGKKVVNHLISLLKDYHVKYGWDTTAQVSLNTLFSYYEFNKKNGLDLEGLFTQIEDLNNKYKQYSELAFGGITRVSKKNIENCSMNFKDFALSRYSLRNFSPGEIPNSVIKEAVKIAQKAPSVCNRQSSKVYVYEGESKRNVLAHQNGNAGFGNDADKVLIVTVELRDFRGPKERNQAYIDGGLFSMSLIYAMHSLGVGTCALNLSLNHKDELKLLTEAEIPHSEIAIMMIAIGKIPEHFYVADSARRDLEDVLKVRG